MPKPPLTTYLLTAVVLLTGCTTIYQSPPDREYWVQKGQAWQGLTSSDGEQVYARDNICRNQDCLLLDWKWSANATMRKYGLLNLQYNSLEKVALEKHEDGRIRLPDDLGAAVYQRLYREEMREDRLDRMGNFRH